MGWKRTVPITAVVTIALLAFPAVAALADSSPAVVREGERWHLRDSLSGGAATTSFTYGRLGDGGHMLCDWNGDGTRTPGVIRNVGGNPLWLLRNSHSGGAADISFVYGRSGDRAVCGDWNGDGTQTPGVIRQRADGLYQWFLRNSNSGGSAHMTFYYARDAYSQEFPPSFPIVGDWNGDGTDTVGLVQGHEDGQMQWLLRDSNTGGTADYDFVYYDGGVWADHTEIHVPIVGDWNGDGRDGPGVVHASESPPRWLLRDDRSAGLADHQFTYGRFLDRTLEWR